MYKCIAPLDKMIAALYFAQTDSISAETETSLLISFSFMSHSNHVVLFKPLFTRWSQEPKESQSAGYSHHC